MLIAITREVSSGINHCEQVIVGELIAAHNTVTASGGTLRLMKLPSKLYNVLGITQIVSVFDVFDDEREAVNSFH